MQADADDSGEVELNKKLSTLATIFPRILPEVFRELLNAFDGESQLQVAVGQLLSHQDQWVRGRWRTDLTASRSEIKKLTSAHYQIRAVDQFRSPSYKKAVRKLLYEEFKVLSSSKIAAVLAEENFSYSLARPTLQRLASKTWRNAFNAWIAKWKKPAGHVTKDHYALEWLDVYGEDAQKLPSIKETGDQELQAELHDAVLRPLLEELRIEQEAKGWNAAITMNESEARLANATYECQCCYSDTTFEQMATCTSCEHVICFECIWHAVSEALFGQSWERNIDHDHGCIKCIAPVSSNDSCDGHLPQIISKRAILQSRGGKEALMKLETRLTEEAYRQSGLALVHCPFCSYVEVDDLYFPPQSIRYRLNFTDIKSTLFLLVMTLNFIPLVLLYMLLCKVFPLQAFPKPEDMLGQSLAHLRRQRYLSRRFQCHSPSCSLQSCLKCYKEWHDPHICHESATLSLRKTVEAARTAALKRTCPQCGLGFIKDSGCNKLTCVCGYSMCYICRQGLGKGVGGEGYRHFCQHFRAAGGTCKECDRCDLYKMEDDENLVRKAGALAEREWREKKGMTGVEGIGNWSEDSMSKPLWNNDWTVQGLLDWWVERVLIC